MQTPMPPNAPNRAYGTTPAAELPPPTAAVPEPERYPGEPATALEHEGDAVAAPSEPDTPSSTLTPTTDSPTSDTDRQSPDEDTAAATARPEWRP
jgi:hypothetical protein